MAYVVGWVSEDTLSVTYKYINTEVSTHTYTQYPLLTVKETVKDNVPVDTDSVIHKLG